VGGPAWVTGGLAALMIVIAAYSAGRLAFSRLRRRETESDADVLHVFMGVAMAGMLVPWLSLLPAAVWQVMFAVAAAWFGWQALRALRGNRESASRRAYSAAHLVECSAMIYMLRSAGSPGPPGIRPAMAMPGMSGPPGAAASFPALALLLALFMLGYTFWTADRLTSLSRATAAQAALSAAPGHQPPPARPAAAAGPPGPSNSPGPPGEDSNGRADLRGRPILAPRLAACCKIAMSIGMSYMLILML
jgi:hypothetical protein